jgi:hypothetical protein
MISQRRSLSTPASRQCWTRGFAARRTRFASMKRLVKVKLHVDSVVPTPRSLAYAPGHAGRPSIRVSRPLRGRRSMSYAEGAAISCDGSPGGQRSDRGSPSSRGVSHPSRRRRPKNAGGRCGKPFCGFPRRGGRCSSRPRRRQRPRAVYAAARAPKVVPSRQRANRIRLRRRASATTAIRAPRRAASASAQVRKGVVRTLR